jgi:hypothetical protein
MNGIHYKFTKEEIEAMSRLLELARLSGLPELLHLSEIIATALNRNAFQSLYK